MTVTKGTNRSKRVAEVPRRDGHYRLVIDGEERKFVSVTTVLNIINKPALVNWAARTAAELVLEDPYTYSTAEQAASGIYKSRDSAGDRGSTVHSWVEALAYGAKLDPDSLPENLKGYGHAALSFWTDNTPDPDWVEVTLYNTKWNYAGTTDLISRLRGQDELWMLDYKTGKAIYDEVGLQLRAYRECDLVLPRYLPCPSHQGESCNVCMGNLAGVRNTEGPIPMPKVDRAAAVLLRQDGTYLIEERDADFGAFLAAKRLWEWNRK